MNGSLWPSEISRQSVREEMTKRQLCDNSDLAFFYHNKKYEYELMSEGLLKHDGDYSFVFFGRNTAWFKDFFCENA